MKRVHNPLFCMYCGVAKPYGISVVDFFAWRCDDCGHAVCKQCKGDMEAVGKSVECCWWNCKGNTQIKVRVRDQFEKPVTVKPYESFEGEIVAANHWYVEINVNEEWMPIEVINIHTEANNEFAPTARDGMRMFIRPNVRAQFELPMDDKNFQYLVEGTLIRACINIGGKLQTMFKGYICLQPSFSVEAQGITMVSVEAIEGRPTTESVSSMGLSNTVMKEMDL